MRTIILLLVLFPSFFTEQVAAQKNTALLIGIGDYPESTDLESGWQSLSSANDLEHISAALLSQGFKKENILLLKDEEATRSNIIKALTNNLLTISEKGGNCIVHFSGHGQQVFDNNYDEADGLDEALVPYDAQKRYQKDVYEGQKHLRDDDLNAALLPLRKKLGVDGQVLVLLDACHSGTGLRAENNRRRRSTDQVIAPANFIRQLDKIKVKEPIRLFNDRKGYAKVVAFYASSPYQSNEECTDDKGLAVGSLSYAFSKALTLTKPKDSYETLFARVQNIMSSKAPEQTPQAEGALHRLVFGGQLTGSQNYFRLSKWRDGKNVQLEAGFLHGFTEGSTVLFYPINSEKPQVFARGIVRQSNLNQAEIQLTVGKISKEQLTDLQVVIENKHYIYQLSAQVDPTIPSADRKAIKQLLVESPAFSVTEDHPDIYINIDAAATKSLRAFDSRGQMIAEAQSVKEFWRKLKRYHAANFLRQVEVETPPISASLALVSTDIDASLSTTTYYFKKGQTFKLQVTNTGTERIYYTVLGIDAENEISVIAPFCDRLSGYTSLKPEDLYLNAGQTATYDFNFEITDPLGTDVLKLLSARKPIDLSYAVTRGTRGSYESLGQIGVLMDKIINEEQTNGKGAFVLPAGEMSVMTVVVETE